MDERKIFDLLFGSQAATEQTLGLTLHRLVDTVEMLRHAVRHAVQTGILDDAQRQAVLDQLRQIETVPAELMLACEILAHELPPTHPGQLAVNVLWFSAFDEIEAQKALITDMLLQKAGPDADPRH